MLRAENRRSKHQFLHKGTMLNFFLSSLLLFFDCMHKNLNHFDRSFWDFHNNPWKRIKVRNDFGHPSPPILLLEDQAMFFYFINWILACSFSCNNVLSIIDPTKDKQNCLHRWKLFPVFNMLSYIRTYLFSYLTKWHCQCSSLLRSFTYFAVTLTCVYGFVFW